MADGPLLDPASPRLGFGCASLSLAAPYRHHEAVLGTAWDAGVRWYDVARLYSYGVAEQTLGRFLRGRRDDAVVVTKFGLTPPSGLAGSAVLRAAARRVTARAPGLKRRLAARADDATVTGDFSLASARASLEASLTALGTDHVDVLLLHEVRPGQAPDELRAWLEQQRQRGTVLRWGTATPSPDVTSAVLREQTWLGDVVQVADDATGSAANAVGSLARLVVTHSLLSQALPRLRSRLDADPALGEALHAAGVARDDLATALLAAALERRPDGVVLFSSQQPERVRQAARALDLLADGRGAALAAALRDGD